MDSGQRWIYIGESARVRRRLLSYERRLGRSRPHSTSTRLSWLIRRALVADEPVYLDTTSNAKMVIESSERNLAMHQKAERQFAEAAAVLQEEASSGENDWVLNKVLDDNGRFIYWAPIWETPESAGNLTG